MGQMQFFFPRFLGTHGPGDGQPLTFPHTRFIPLGQRSLLKVGHGLVGLRLLTRREGLMVGFFLELAYVLGANTNKVTERNNTKIRIEDSPLYGSEQRHLSLRQTTLSLCFCLFVYARCLLIKDLYGEDTAHVAIDGSTIVTECLQKPNVSFAFLCSLGCVLCVLCVLCGVEFG